VYFNSILKLTGSLICKTKEVIVVVALRVFFQGMPPKYMYRECFWNIL